jgi:hypothetical protein
MICMCKRNGAFIYQRKSFSDWTNVNVLTDDDTLYDIFIDNHKAAAPMENLSTQHLEKLNDKNVLKKGWDLLQ